MKTYKALVSFGDGKPLCTSIEAKNGLTAQDVGFASYPGARVIRILGVLSETLPPVVQEKEHPLFSEPINLKEIYNPVPIVKAHTGLKLLNRDELITEATRLRKGGWSYLAISKKLNVGKTTVRRWMWDAKVP